MHEQSSQLWCTFRSDKSVVAKDNIAATYLTLTPASRRIVLKDEKEKQKEKSSENTTDFELDVIVNAQKKATFVLHRHLQPCYDKPNPWVALFWIVLPSTTEDASKANMKIMFEQVEKEFQGNKMTIKFTVIQNYKHIAAGEKLLLLKSRDASAASAAGSTGACDDQQAQKEKSIKAPKKKAKAKP